ncbi:hypothetical protein KR51_00006600 [Rubidibacter lacunae KORDI 51-2]|uniref:NACHT N-terminal Helical domain-containing protein n=1 Tax=Rubidibacter lacunae KORDI 51-2 TaxID=582515 RepID=U5DLV1_9CHRO|nr:hypothetical protein [Rubidibacter lacunae]ERN42631.1 hypothetical protein KR51_00006600 [Rubidibacter lacunae KORDI 51-2]
MSDPVIKFGLRVMKPVSVWNQELKADFRNLFKALGKAGGDEVSGKWLGVGKDSVDALFALGLKVNEPGQLSWSLIYNSLQQATV